MFLHLEITSKCPLKCPACARTLHAGSFSVRELGLDEIANILSSKRKFEQITLCGDHGDPIYHSRFHEVISLIKETHPELPVFIATNGSFRSFDWWVKTAELLGPSDIVNFGIDGLEDTSKIYRQGSDWTSIMTAIEALKLHGRCQLHWQWLLFRYNESQISEGLKLAKQLGFDQFKITKSYRQEGAAELYQPTLSLQKAVEDLNHADFSAL